MQNETISIWRPQRFDEVIGAVNASHLRYLQDIARSRRRASLLLLGPKGIAKTSVARLLIKSLHCRQPNPHTADPCLKCENCLAPPEVLDGVRRTFGSWEIDCSQIETRAQLSRVLQEILDDYTVATPVLFADELQRLPEIRVQSVLLKFVEDFDRGVFIAAAMNDGSSSHCRKLMPALVERLSKIYFCPPSHDELASFLAQKCPTWGVNATEDGLRSLVIRARGSFRTCLQTIERALVSNAGRLDSRTLASLPPPGPDEPAETDPFADL